MLICFFSLFVLVGCGSQTSSVPTDQNTQEIAWPSAVKATGVPLCDNYLSALQCIANYATGSDKMNFNSSYESLVQSFQNVPATQLTETCTTLSNALRSHPTILKDYPSCNVL